MTPFLTIVTVTYNAGMFLDRTLASVARAMARLDSEYSVEYLLLDGASNDDTLEVAARYDEIFSFKVLSEPDKGLYDAMNKGQRIASGRYLWFLNAGDEIHDELVLSRLSESTRSDADIYYSDALMVSSEGKKVGLRSIITPHALPTNISWRDMALGMKICHQAFIVKRELSPRYEVDNLSADLDWEIAAMKKASRIEYLDFVLCKYLLGGLSAQRRRRSLVDRWRVLRRHFGGRNVLLNHFRIAVRGFVFALRNGKYW